MALFKKSTLGSAILTAIAASSASAATGDSMMDGMFNDSFFSDSKMTLQLKNYYRKVTDRPDAGPTDRDSAWAQAMHLDYQSGWFMNWVGLDLSSYYSLKLSGSKEKSNVGLLNYNDNKSRSYGKVGYALKVNLMDHGVLKYGRMIVDTPLLKSRTEYALPSLYEGFYGDVFWEGLKGYVGYFTKINRATQSGFENLSANDSSSNLKKRAVTTYGLEYQIDSLTLRVARTTQKDFEDYTYADATYMMPTADMGDFTFGAQYGSNSANGALKDAVKADGNKTSLSWWGAMFSWKLDNLTAGLSHVQIGSDQSKHSVDADGNDDIDSLTNARMVTSAGAERFNSGNRFIGYTAGLVNDFADAGTRSTRIDVGYDMSDFVDGLSISAGYIFGTVNYGSGNEDHDVSEFDVGVSYQIPFVKGLSAELQHGRYLDSYKSDGEKMKDRQTDTRIILNYEIAVF